MRRTSVAVLTAAAAALTVGLSAAPASAATTSIRGYMGKQPSNYVPGYYDVTVVAYAETGTLEEAQRHISNGYRIYVTLMGEDPVFDDVLGVRALLIPQARYWSGPGGSQGPPMMYARKTWVLPGSRLDEDPEGLLIEDEIYAVLRLTGRDGRPIYLNGRTKTVIGRF